MNFFKKENSWLYDYFVKGLDGKDKNFNVKLNPFDSNKDIVDNQVAIIEYENSVRATFHTNLSSGLPERRMYICGTKGTIRGDVNNGLIEVQRIFPSDKKEKNQNLLK